MEKEPPKPSDATAQDPAKIKPKRPTTPEGGTGYGDPPKHSQYVSGQSGNPSGKKAGTLNADTVLANTLSRPIPAADGSGTVSALEAVCLVALKEALKGRWLAIKFLVKQARKLQGGAAVEPQAELPEADAAIIARFLERKGRGTGEERDTDEQ